MNGNSKYLHAPMDICAYMFVPTAIRYFYNGHYHWAIVVCAEGKLYLCDSLVSDIDFEKINKSLNSKYIICPCNSRRKDLSVNCGIYTIAYAFHAANGDYLRK